jgi:predicted nucleic-acid-binding Zn-ribbon protein
MFDNISDIEKEINDPNSKYMKLAQAHMDACEKKYQQEHPCPKCGSHNTHLEPIAICGAKSSWIEWCDDCKWEKETDCGCG